jgi:uncharacterized caspase-like protein
MSAQREGCLMRRIVALCFVLGLLCGSAFAAEQRVALVIGNAAYRSDPLDNAVNDARLVASSLQQAGFDVALAENLDRHGLLGALRAFGERLNDNSVAVLYYAGHGLQLRDRNYLIPVDAEIRSEDEIALAGIDIAFVLGRMSAARSRVNIVILDACRNNPFASSTGKGQHTAQGLAQMDAPVGTLLAYATAPGKLAADGLGGVNEKNGLYAQQLARQLLQPGLPVEHVFKRVREAVVRASREAQVPWESSSLQGEFAFVAGTTAVAREGATSVDAAAELAFWNSVQGTARADDLRAYLRQYPSGRFAALAQSRLGAAAPETVAANTAVSDTLPRVGDQWRYRVQDQFRLGDLFVTAKVEAVNAQGIAESRTTSTDNTPRSARVALAPSFNAVHETAPPEFSPYLQAAGLIGPALRGAELSQQVEQATVPLRASVEGIEVVQVAGGTWRAQKVVLRGQAQSRGAAKSGLVVTEHRLWYAAEVKRVIKHEITTTVGGTLRQSTSVELVEFSVR